MVVDYNGKLGSILAERSMENGFAYSVQKEDKTSVDKKARI